MPRGRSDSGESKQSRNARDERSEKKRDDRSKGGKGSSRGRERDRDDGSPSRSERDRSESPRWRGGADGVRTSTEISMKKHEKSEERRRYLKWLSFTKSKISFGFQHLTKEYVPVMSENFHVRLIRVTDKYCDYEITYDTIY